MNKLVKAKPYAEPSRTQDDEGQFLTFHLGGEMFAIGILGIKEIIEYGQITSVPMMPSFVRGVINLRGQVVPVIDLQLRFGRSNTEAGKRACIVIADVESEIEGERQEIGLIVDAVSEVLAIPPGDIEPAPAFGAKLRQDFVSGMGKVNGKFVIILNVENVLSINELAELANQVNEFAS